VFKEIVLRDFFLGRATIAELCADLKDAVRNEGPVQKYPILDMSEDYSVTCQDLIKLCDAVLAEELPPSALEPIGFCLIASDHFEWDSDDPDGEIVAETIADWAAPEINYPLTLENVRMFRERLEP
jgi:hypothetical protein